jgi:hypothetical protein
MLRPDEVVNGDECYYCHGPLRSDLRHLVRLKPIEPQYPRSPRGKCRAGMNWRASFDESKGRINDQSWRKPAAGKP